MFASVAAWNSGLGISTMFTGAIKTRSPSVSKKKNSLSFLMAPPKEPAH